MHLNGSVKEPNKFHNYETEKITRKASDVAEYMELFGSFTRYPHARCINVILWTSADIRVVVHDNLGWKNRTTPYNCRFSATSLALRVIFVHRKRPLNITYFNRLQPALQNLLQHVRFFHPRSSCMMHISVDIFGGQKSLAKPVMRQKTCNYIELFSSSTRDRHARWRICRRTFRE